MTVFNPQVEAIKELKDETRFTFLFCGGYKDGRRDRKGLDIALEAFAEEFKGEDARKVRFIAKVNTAYATPQQIQEQVQSIDLGPADDRGQVTLIVSNAPDQKGLARIYASADCLVAPSKSEGFGMHLLEAKACGLPVIATRYGGHLDFLDDDKAFLIDVEKMIPATAEAHLYEQCEWALPSKPHLKKLMREVFEIAKGKPIVRPSVVKNVENWTWEKTSLKIIKLLDKQLNNC